MQISTIIIASVAVLILTLTGLHLVGGADTLTVGGWELLITGLCG